MKPEDKYVAVKVPKDLHLYLKGKAKESKMTLGNYLFDCICKHHNIKYVPASVELPVEEEKVKDVVEEVVIEEEPENDSPLPTEVQKDVAKMESEEPTVEESVVEEPVVEESVAEESVVEEPTVEEPVVEEPEKVQDTN